MFHTPSLGGGRLPRFFHAGCSRRAPLRRAPRRRVGSHPTRAMGKKTKGINNKQSGGIDFIRAKKKVGRKIKKSSNNATDTTVRAKRINLSTQTLGAEGKGDAVTSRGLSMPELLNQTTHYSERVRKDALEGIRELLQSHPESLVASAATVVEKVAERLVDQEQVVRTAARAALKSGLLPALGPHGLAPFARRLVLHVGAALTHVAPAVRRDAPRVLEALPRRRAPSRRRARPGRHTPPPRGPPQTRRRRGILLPRRRARARRERRRRRRRATRGRTRSVLWRHDGVARGRRASGREAQAPPILPSIPRGSRRWNRRAPRGRRPEPPPRGRSRHHVALGRRRRGVGSVSRHRGRDGRGGGDGVARAQERAAAALGRRRRRGRVRRRAGESRGGGGAERRSRGCSRGGGGLAALLFSAYDESTPTLADAGGPELARVRGMTEALTSLQLCFRLVDEGADARGGVEGAAAAAAAPHVAARLFARFPRARRPGGRRA